MENSKASNMPAYPRAVNHVGVGVADIERAIRWYQEVLGFTLLMGPIEVRATDPGSNVHDVLGQDRNAYGIPHGPGKAKPLPDLSMEAAACFGCGGCVAACPNSSAMLFVAAKVSHLGLLPQGQAERNKRMVRKMDELGFGNCRNHYECEAACPAEINAMFISRLNRDYVVAATREGVAV
jgi:ferredoxin